MHVRLASIVVVVCIAMAASASPKQRVTVLDFEGPTQLADKARDVVVKILGDRCDLVPPRNWMAAKMTTVSRGPLPWAAAAKSAGVDAVVEGWVDPDGVHTHDMTVAVRDASTGEQIDTISVKISDQGAISDDQTRTLSRGLDDLLTWLDGPTAPPPARLPAVIADASYPTDEPVIEVLLTGGFSGHHEGAVVWANGTVQVFGPRCTRAGKLAPKRVAALIDVLDQSGIFATRDSQRMCLDGFEFEIDVRKGDQRVAAHASCSNGSLPAQASKLVWSVLGPNPCGADNNKSGDDDDE